MVFLLPFYLIRLQIGGIPTTFLELGIYLVFLIYLWRCYQKKAVWRWNGYYTLAMVFLGLVLMNVLFVSDDKINSLGLWKGWFFDPMILMLVVANSLKNMRQLELLRQGFVFLLGLLGGVAFIQLIFGVTYTPDGRVSAFFSSANYLAMLLWPALLIVLVTTWKNRKIIWWEVIFWLLGCLALLFSASYVGIGSFLLGVLMYSWMKTGHNIKNVLVVILFIIILASGFVASQWGTERLNNMIDLGRRSSITVRLQVWQVDWAIILDRMWLGIGLGNYERQYLEYAPILFHPPLEWRMLHGHNLFLHTWVELGLLGLILLLLIIVSWWRKLMQLLKKKDYYWWVVAIMIVLAGWIVGGMLDTPYYKNDLSILFWLLFGITIAIEQNNN